MPTTDDKANAPPTAADLASKIAETRKTNAEAEKIEVDNANSRLTAGLGTVAAGPYSGEVKLTDHAAMAEASMLGMDQTRKLAIEIANSAALSLTGQKALLVTTSATGVNLTAARAVDDLLVSLKAAASRALAQLSAASAQSSSTQKGTTGTGPERSLLAAGITALGSSLAGISPITAAGTLLANVHSLLGYFRSNYQASDVPITASERALLRGVAGQLKTKPDLKIYLDGIVGESLPADQKALDDDLKKLAEDFTRVGLSVQTHEAAIAAIHARAVAATKTPPDCATPEDAAALAVHEEALAICKAALELYATVLTALKADAGGQSLLQRSLREKHLRKLLGAKPAVLILNLEGAWATLITKEGMAPAAGAPISVSSTVAGSWTLYDLETGQFLGGDIEGNRSGLVEMTKVPLKIKV